MKIFICAIYLCHLALVHPRSIPNALTTEKVVDFLQYHGYAPGWGERTQLTSEEIEKALKKYQEFFHLPVTGKLDAKTLEMLQQERCDVPDFRTPRYAVSKYKWPKDIFWGVNQTHSSVPRNTARRIVAESVQEWTSKIGLKITEFSDTIPEIVINFVVPDASGNHGDNRPFKDTTLAHAFYPIVTSRPSISGDVHVNMKFSFSVTEPPGISETSLKATLVHELGHSLGLNHSSVRTSIMYPSIARGQAYAGLDADDIAGIQKLYGDGATVIVLAWSTAIACLLAFLVL